VKEPISARWERARSGCAWLVGGGVLGTLILGVFLIGIPWVLGPPEQTFPTPVLTVVPAPTETPPPPTEPPTLTPIPPTATPVPPPISAGGFSQGDLVEVSGTSGDGLRLRSDPSLAGSINALAIDHEVYRVEQGPVEADDYTWWFLVNPYDDSRKGWAVANYLRPLQSP
jgi:hypothetical protein